MGLAAAKYGVTNLTKEGPLHTFLCVYSRNSYNRISKGIYVVVVEENEEIFTRDHIFYVNSPIYIF